MGTLPHIDDAIHQFLENYDKYKADRGENLSELIDVLDLYLLSVMEEEDLLYQIMCQRAHDFPGFKNMKILSPGHLQFNVLLSLPFHRNQIQVESAQPGYVKLKLPVDVEEGMKTSKVWQEACYKGLDKSLLRHIHLWKDEDHYLKQRSVLNWFGEVVDRSLKATGSIPNYEIIRVEKDQKILLRVRDIVQDSVFFVTLLPVFAFSVSQLPEEFSCISGSSECVTWMAECQPCFEGIFNAWQPCFWEHERNLIASSNLKPIIRVLKGLRDSKCERNNLGPSDKLSVWHMLTNPLIRTFVLLTHKHDPVSFETLSVGEMLLKMLLILRNHLVSGEGLPDFWSPAFNVLCGMTGPERSHLAREVTRSRDFIQDPHVTHFLRLETYPSNEAGSATDSQHASFESAKDQVHSTILQEPSKSLQVQTSSTTRVAPVQITPSSLQHSCIQTEARSGRSSVGVMQQDRGSSWWGLGSTAAAAAIGTVAVVAGAVTVALIGSNRNKRS